MTFIRVFYLFHHNDYTEKVFHTIALLIWYKQ